LYSFTNNELKVFKAIGQGNLTASGIAAKCGLSLRATYAILSSLNRKKIVNIFGKKNRVYVTGDRLHALAMRRFFLEQNRPIGCISGAKLPLLLSIQNVKKGRERIAIETKLKVSSVRRLIVQLAHYGLIERDGDTYRVPEKDPIQGFLSDFAYGSCQSVMEDVTGQGVMQWHSGLEVVFSTKEEVESPSARPTGVTAMASAGLMFIAPSKYYQMSYWSLDLSVEEIAVHEMVATSANPRAIAIAVLYLRKVGFDRDRFANEARWRGTDAIASDVLRYMNGGQPKSPLFPDPKEIDEITAQYGVMK
jgi:hypothetical protein